MIYRGFVTATGAERLADVERYLHAIERRLEKLGVDPHRDRAQMLRVEQVQQAWQQWIQRLPAVRRQAPEVQAIRWMIEELRVSYFAQQLGTPYPVSDKRIQQAMEALEQGKHVGSGMTPASLPSPCYCIRRCSPPCRAVTATAWLSAKARFSGAGAEL